MMPVYPRVCGGTAESAESRHSSHGLSPRMRGNRGAFWGRCPWPGSIPAYAGEPVGNGGWQSAQKVYPRVCGGTCHESLQSMARVGLSPRMRGNPRTTGSEVFFSRSIPAYAGEPRNRMPAAAAARVYPRVCGGTRADIARRKAARGLSPRMRGNPLAPVMMTAPVRSIPAYAGEPQSGPPQAQGRRVYPRVCGGTHPAAATRAAIPGLSPRMRGNPGLCYRSLPPARSIPAYAGEPDSPCLCRPALAVYPRVCGGTGSLQSMQVPISGLSPRMRGNPGRPACGSTSKGSIPAYAGEPIR